MIDSWMRLLSIGVFVNCLSGLYSLEQPESVVLLLLVVYEMATLKGMYFAAMVVPSSPKKAMFLKPMRLAMYIPQL